VLAYKPTTSQQYPVGCRAVEPSRSEEQRRFCLFPLQTRALNKQVTNYNRAKINKTLRSEMEEGGQSVVIGGSDSAELDKLQLQRDRVLCIRSSASLSTPISVQTGNGLWCPNQRTGTGALKG
jgi:hypothetical protein